MDEAVNCKVALAKSTFDILQQMAEEDHVSVTTEIENAISGWYRMRHGFTGIEKTREIEKLQRELAECDRRIQDAKLLAIADRGVKGV